MISFYKKRLTKKDFLDYIQNEFTYLDDNECVRLTENDIKDFELDDIKQWCEEENMMFEEVVFYERGIIYLYCVRKQKEFIERLKYLEKFC